MAFDTERAARRLTDAGLDERAANGVADVVGSATNGLATEASLQAAGWPGRLRREPAGRPGRL